MSEKEEFIVYREGPCYASVCSNPPQAIVEARLRERREGLLDDLVWKLSKDLVFATEEGNPHPCERNPETHTHYLFDC